MTTTTGWVDCTNNERKGLREGASLSSPGPAETGMEHLLI